MHRYAVLTLAVLCITASTPAQAIAAEARDLAGIAYHYTSLAEAPLPDGYVFNDLTVGLGMQFYGANRHGSTVLHAMRI